MVTDYIKTGSLQPRDLFREVAPVSPYPRINPQQPRQEGYPRQQQEAELGQKKHMRRRFTTMRKLIDRLKESELISRVNYSTAENELRSKGLEIAEEHLIPRLLELKIPLNSIDQILLQIRQQTATIGLTSGAEVLSDQRGPFPISAVGLTEFNLEFAELKIAPGKQHESLVEKIKQEGAYSSERNRMRLSFFLVSSQPYAAADSLQLKISVLVAAMEFDEAGRRAIVYQRPNQSYALYADKQINLSI